MEETGEVKGSCLAVGLASMPDELDDDLIQGKLPLRDLLCGPLIRDAVTKDVQEKSFENDTKENQ